LSEPAVRCDQVRRTLERYDPALVRQVAARLIKPRGEWPVEELIDRCAAAVVNPATIDRRLRELDVSAQRLLALIGHSRQPRWRLGNLLELLAALGHAEGPRPVLALFEAGLLVPDLPVEPAPLRNFEEWLGQGSATGFSVWAPPLVTAHALGTDLGLPECPGATSASGPVHEADGLEWPLRLAVLWQQVTAAPMRRTQQGDFFKRDLDRLRNDPLLNGPAADGLAELPDAGLLAVCLAQATGSVRDSDGELEAALLPAAWEEGLPAALASFFATLPQLDNWDPLAGWRGVQPAGNPFRAAYLLALLLLARLPEGAWAAPAALGQWVEEHHPYWDRRISIADFRLAEKDLAAVDNRKSKTESRKPNIDWATPFLLGLAHQLRWVQAARDAGGAWVVRLSPVGRWLLGLGGLPTAEAPPAPTLLVQPNLEIIAYRQGLTPGLIGRLARFASWKSLGAACTLQLEPETAYRALESGETLASILQTLEQHGTRATPAPVVELLRTWSNKRDRLTVYPAAALLEFSRPEDLNEALARGLPGLRLTDRLAVVPNEARIDYRHFRLVATRDYSLPPDRCVAVEADGVTLTVDAARSDLLLETELPRFAEPLPAGPAGRRQYRLTPESLAAAAAACLGAPVLEAWFQQRTGRSIPASAHLLLTGAQLPPPDLRRHLVLHVATEEIADGLLQWPPTGTLIEDRLGPTALVVSEENVSKLQEQLRVLGMLRGD
jgi:hypothetical protein